MPLTDRQPPRRNDPDALLGRCFHAETPTTRGIRVRWDDGDVTPLPVQRWLGDATHAERVVLDRVRGPVLDVGCGPGRHVAELQRRGITALGIDVLPEAVARARRRGASAMSRSVFGRVPLAGTWRTALLLDGNVGIGGDPVELLRRVGALLVPGGSALIEVEDEGIGLSSAFARLESPNGETTAFRWGRVGIDGVDELADATGFAVRDTFGAGGRWFAVLAT